MYSLSKYPALKLIKPRSTTVAWPHHLSVYLQYNQKIRKFFQRLLSTNDPNLDSTSCVLDDNSITFKYMDGVTAKFHHIWLRDHCRCPECFHSTTNQRQIDTFKIPLEIKPRKVTIIEEHVRIEWPDGHVSDFKTPWLKRYKYGQSYHCFDVSDIEKVLWDAREAKNFPQDSVFSEVLNCDQKLLEYFEKLVKYGIAFLSGIEKPYDQSLRLLGNRLGFIQETLFGDVWTFTSGKVDFADTAYLSMRLECHNDGTYFHESPGLQVLHCDAHDGQGGDNFFVDGFHVANQLRKSYPDSFAFLSKTKVPSFYYEKNKYLYKNFDSIIKVNEFTNDVYQIRFNSCDRDILSCLTFEEVEKFYDASHKLTRFIRDGSNELIVKPQSGRAAVFDNWRVFHARTGFTGTRSITGFYVRKGDYLSMIHALRQKILSTKT